jgi:hypothetical protein
MGVDPLDRKEQQPCSENPMSVALAGLVATAGFAVASRYRQRPGTAGQPGGCQHWVREARSLLAAAGTDDESPSRTIAVPSRKPSPADACEGVELQTAVLGGVTHVIVLAAERSPLLAACAWGRGGGGWGPFTSNVRLRR